jgi:uncharacterized coiled-coil DUF342 family protein
MNWLVKNWEALLGLIVTVSGTFLAVYKRFTRMEDRIQMLEQSLDKHIKEDREMRNRLDEIVTRLDSQATDVRLLVTTHETLLKETRQDLREVRDDIKELLSRR